MLQRAKRVLGRTKRDRRGLYYREFAISPSVFDAELPPRRDLEIESA
jgi:hypothetical protein